MIITNPLLCDRIVRPFDNRSILSCPQNASSRQVSARS
jgi:hypothetical protein